MCAKTRVAPIEFKSIPRLELCGVLLLAQLMHRVAKNLGVPKENIYLWTDSAIVVIWLNVHASKWQTYVAHRVKEIQNLFPAIHWNHFRTHENPADVATR